MESKYEIVETIYNHMSEHIQKELDDIFVSPIYTVASLEDIFCHLAYRYGHYEQGSGRSVIVLEQQGIVLKFPWNRNGLIQNQIEYDRSREYDCPDVLENHSYKNIDNFLLVSPYYQPVGYAIDAFIHRIFLASQQQEMSIDAFIQWSIDIACTKLDEKLVDLLSWGVDSQISNNQNEPLDMTLDEYLEFFDIGSTQDRLIDTFSISGFVDTSYDNFGITDNGDIVLIDGGIDDSEILQECLSDHNMKHLMIDELERLFETV